MDLETAGHQVIEAANGRQGLDFCKGMSTDLAIVDIVMPEMDGLEEIRELKEHFPDLKIIGITGMDPDGEKGYLELAETLGAHRTLSKPFDAKELVGVVQELLGG